MGGRRIGASLTNPSTGGRSRKFRRSGRLATIAVALLGTALLGSSPAGAAGVFHARFLLSASEDPSFSIATLPLYRGASGAQSVYFVVTEASDQDMARRLAVNFSPKLALAKGSAAVTNVTVANEFRIGDRFLAALPTIGIVRFPASVNFAPVRQLAPGPDGFPPSVAQPGAVAETGYSPLIQLPSGVVLNAPHVLNTTGRADKVRGVDMGANTVRYAETEGRYEHKTVHYMSFEASDPVAAAIEDVTFAPALGASPTAARERLLAFVNGQTGLANPNRQGLNSTLLDNVDPLNILNETPVLFLDIGSLAYSPLWGVRFGTWLVPVAERIRQTDFADVTGLEAQGKVAGMFPGFVVNCPLVSIDIPF
jgi:hypothetical protein